MTLSLSNIAWDAADDEAVYTLMRQHGYTALEIAPTRIFPTEPYSRLSEAASWAKELRARHSLTVCSMQSIWYGKTERLFGTEKERAALLDYTKSAVDFARAIGCRHLVFGCPKNRIRRMDTMPVTQLDNSPASQHGASKDEEVIDFFRQAARYAAERGVVIGMEANPAIYGTDYINTTEQAIELVQEAGEAGFKLNLDTGAMIANGEDASVIEGKVALISHVHISEPRLASIQERQLHTALCRTLRAEGYTGCVSIEMGQSPSAAKRCIEGQSPSAKRIEGRAESLKQIEETMEYVKGVFGDDADG